jgi:hypothetical protein
MKSYSQWPTFPQGEWSGKLLHWLPPQPHVMAREPVWHSSRGCRAPLRAPWLAKGHAVAAARPASPASASLIVPPADLTTNPSPRLTTAHNEPVPAASSRARAVYIGGEFFGGADIVTEAYMDGSLAEQLEVALAS